MDYLTTATGKLVSTNCLFFQMKKERDEKLNDVKNRVKKLFIYYHQEALVNPIIEAIIENVFVFGQSQYSANSFNLLNVDEKKRRLPQKRRFRRIRSCKTYEDDESTEISSLSSLDEHEVENSSTRSVKVVSLKLKRLSVTKENKDDAHLRSLKKVKARCDELMESLFPEKLPSAVIVDPIVEKIADRAWFQFKVRQWRRDQEETDSEESCDVTSDCQDEDESFAVVDPLIQQIVDHARIRGKFRLCRQKIADGLIESVISSSSSSSLLTAEEANESIIDHETDEDFDLPQLRLEEKMNMYLNRYQPETENAAMQTATEEDGPVLLITGVPNSYSSIDSAAKILKKHGTLTELKIQHHEKDDYGNAIVVKYKEKIQCERALEAMRQAPFGKPWLSAIVKSEICFTQIDLLRSKTSSTPLVIIGDTLVEESERIAEKKCSDVCSLYESRHEYASYESCNRHYGEDYEYEDDEEIASEALQEAFEKCIEMFKEPKNMENLQHLLNLADLLDSLQVDFISEGKITELTENVDNELIGLILEMSLNQTLDGETLKNISTECLKHRPLDEVFLKIPENWLRLFDGEQIDEPKEVIELRYDLLTNSERFQEALFIVKNYPSPEILHKHLKLTLAAAKENPDSKIDEVFQTMDHIHSLSSHDVVGLNCVEQLNKMIQIVPSARKPDGVALLLKFLKKEGYNSVLSLIAANGTKEDVENSISVINTKLSSSSEITPEARRKLFKCLFKEVASLHPITFDRIFSMGLREVGKNWSNDLFDLLLKQCQQPGRRKPSAEIKIVQFLRNMNRGAISSNTILEKVISTFTGTCPELLSQVADVIIDRFDPYPHFQLLVASGSMLTMKKFLQKYEMDRGLTRSLNSTSPTTIVLAIMENLLPRFPTFRGELIAFFVKCFKADPVIFQEEMCPLFSSESDLLPIMSYIEEKTAFGQRWIQELPSIIRKLLKLAIPKAWNGIKESCMSIVTEQFAHDPQSWASFVLKYGTNEDASKAASALSECIQSQPEKANDTEMFNLIYSLVSKLPNKWPQAVEHVKKLLQAYFEKVTKVNVDHVKALFSLSNFWRTDALVFRKCLESLFRKMKGQAIPVNNWMAILEPIVTVSVGNYDHVNNVRMMLKQVTDRLKQLAALCQETSHQWERSTSLLPQCTDRLGSEGGRRCSGCLQLADFLQSGEEQARNITVNQNLRSCIKRLLVTRVINTGGGPQMTVAEALCLKFEEVDANTNRSQYRQRYCGAIRVVKKEAVDRSQLSKIAMYQKVLQEIGNLSQRLQASSIQRVAPVAQTSATATSSSGITVYRVIPNPATIKREASTGSNLDTDESQAKRIRFALNLE